ncbi:SCO0930 family lipoprotein [Streptomyces sp. ST2-7A]|uniref:SCO0930 family lipoprotein n=1 Tax=Streptomyces sp. ST2-7A TaxID=2907214 RepID=UPI001F48C9AD|nr:SCO0930 family lipoprotein [Streptomyces sp. ST2-7A]MCE7083075.1 SCO0930 family lipoprotein [Streptomyces sp. ST2-7A]
MRTRRCTAPLAAIAALFLATACGTDVYGQGDTQPAANQAGVPEYGADHGSTDTAAEVEPAGRLVVRDTPDLGAVVTDSRGFTLYRFEEDTADPARSTCNDACATAWPPVPADDASAAEGIDADLLGEVERADGGIQLTLSGWPVYRYQDDTAPGDVNGHGVNGTWNALAPDGKPASADNAAQETAGEEGPALSVVQDPSLGPIVTDAKGRTLYRFDKDSAWPMISNCEGECLDTWKPALPVDPEEIKGIDAELISTLERDDGTEQLAIDCWPVYWFTGDENPGDTTGHGAGDLWFAVTPSGAKAPL